MNQIIRSTPSKYDEDWLRVLAKGLITLPKKWREELGFFEGDLVKAVKEGNKIIVKSSRVSKAPYRVFTDGEIEEFLKDDRLTPAFSKKIEKKINSLKDV